MSRRAKIGKPEETTTKPRQEVNIKVDLKELGRENVEWIHLVQDRDHWRTVVNGMSLGFS
jgi:hypothetical protein